jgi:uncharacterized protein YwqG
MSQDVKIIKKKFDEKKLKSSRIGGKPSLPSSMPWPKFRIKGLSYSRRSNVLKKVDQEVPYDFLAQINCKELPTELHKAGFPTDGMIFFFVKNDHVDYGLSSREDYKVLYAPAKSIPDQTKEKPKKPRGYDNEERWEIPKESLEFETSYESELGDLFQTNTYRSEGMNRIGCKPKWIQDDMTDTAQRDTYGSGAKLPHETLHKKWTLLLQLDLDYTGIYFLIPTADLKKKDFSRVWCIDQYT